MSAAQSPPKVPLVDVELMIEQGEGAWRLRTRTGTVYVASEHAVAAAFGALPAAQAPERQP